MRYYEVLVGDMQFHGDGALTYAWDEPLLKGAVVRIALRSRPVLGIVLREVPKPHFTTKPISAVSDAPALPSETLQLLHWLHSYYPAPMGTIVRQFLPPSTAFKPKARIEADTIQTVQTPPSTEKDAPNITAAQQLALDTITIPGTYLLHGVTGSGKTRVYQELAKKCLLSGRSVIVLTPEIGLTEHLVQSLSDLPAKQFVLHSQLTTAARRDVWYDILSASGPVVVIGPRSALFTPVKNIGLIIMDESHDQAYKNDGAPHYRTDRVAAKLAQLHNAPVVYGTATPNIEDAYVMETKNRPIITMQERAIQSESQSVTELVDMRDSKNFGRSRILTTPLLQTIDQALSRGEQSLLFLNRRGTANTILCSSCGWRAVCEHCDLPITYHSDAHQLRCHVCGRKQPLPSACPDCQSADILYKTIGTKAVESEIQRLFPAARVKRFDTDIARDDQIQNQLHTLQDGTVDIIIGTQMVTKGLDLPKLAVVGVINADQGLMMPDFTASERTYQLLAQVVGRVGRGHTDGKVILQTYVPDNPTLNAAASQDWTGHYTRELAERRAYHFPPFCFLAKLTCLRASATSAESAATKLKQQIEKDHPRVTVEGPSPAFHPRESKKYKWQLIVKSSSRQALIAIIDSLPSGWQHDLDPTNLL